MPIWLFNIFLIILFKNKSHIAKEYKWNATEVILVAIYVSDLELRDKSDHALINCL